jgi:mannose-1-phosphate guanylyltransferase
MFESGDWMWNPGYFVFDIDFVLGLYKKFLPSMYIALEDMVNDEQKLEHEYENLESISFDNGIVEKVEPSQAVVLKVDLGWSDPGTLYALKEALTKKQDENYAKGNVILHETSDSFILNDEKEKLVATVGLEGMIVVNTKDALLVCHKDKVPEIKELLRKMGGEGLEKYL